jgi:hypothetical protein
MDVPLNHFYTADCYKKTSMRPTAMGAILAVYSLVTESGFLMGAVV